MKNIACTVYDGFFTFNEDKNQCNSKHNNDKETTEKQIHMITYLPKFSI